MTDHAPLTDEELAAMKGLVLGNATTLRRLIAEVERLRAALWRAPEDWLKGDDEAWFALTGEGPEVPA